MHMATAECDSIGPWSLKLSPTSSVAVQPGGPLRLANITVDHSSALRGSRTTLVLKYLSPGTQCYISSQIGSVISPFSQTAGLHTVLRPGTTYILETIGNETIHLAGYFLEIPHDSHDHMSGIVDHELADRHARKTILYSVNGLSMTLADDNSSTHKRKQGDTDQSTHENEVSEVQVRSIKRLKASGL